MNARTILLPLGALALMVFGFTAWGWPGVLAAAGAFVMWGLLHFTRLVSVMHKAARHPVGHVGSAVMFNARLSSGQNLLHLLAITQALGEQLSASGAQPEVYRWSDSGGSHVTCTLRNGKLRHWVLQRPGSDAGGAGGGGHANANAANTSPATSAAAP